MRTRAYTGEHRGSSDLAENWSMARGSVWVSRNEHWADEARARPSGETAGCGMIKGFPRRSAWPVGYVKRVFNVSQGQTMHVDSQNVRRLRWGWRPALTRGTQAALRPALGRRMSFEGAPYRILVWSSRGITHRRPVSPHFRQKDAQALVDRYERRHARLADLLDSRSGAVRLLSKYTGLVEPFIADVAAGVLCLEGGFADVVEEVLELPRGWFDSVDVAVDAGDVEWPGWGEPAVLKLRESGKAALIDDWVTGAPSAEPGKRCLVARNLSMSLPFPARPAGEGAPTSASAVVPRTLHAPVRYRRLSDGKTQRAWLRRVTAYKQIHVGHQGTSRHLPVSLPEESIELARRRPPLTIQSSVEQGNNFTGAQARAQAFLASEQHRLDKLREKKLGLRRKNVEQFRRSLQRDDLVASVTGLEVALLDALDWTREPALMCLLTKACEVPADWFDWKREELETKMIGRRFVPHATDLLSRHDSHFDEAPMSTEAILALWSGPRSATAPAGGPPDHAAVADAPAHDAPPEMPASAARSERLQPLPDLPVLVSAALDLAAPFEYAGLPSDDEALPVGATCAEPVQGEFSFAPTHAAASRDTARDLDPFVTSRPTFVSDRSIERLVLSVSPHERPILDALIVMIAKAAREGRLTEDRALSMLTRVAAL